MLENFLLPISRSRTACLLILFWMAWSGGACPRPVYPQDLPWQAAMDRINPQMEAPLRVDEAAAAAAGIRQIDSRHLRMFTDLPESADPEQYARLFDAAVPLWCERFSVPPARADQWRITAFLMADRSRFAKAGLLPEELPDFPTGYNRGHQIWVILQPGNYYTRHMILHEGTHAFMQWFLGGSGPPWYSEGMAELLGLHRLSETGQLTIGARLRSREECEYWGRVKVLREAVAAGEARPLDQVFDQGSIGFADLEAYSWSWAACEFLAGHPLSARRFAQLAERAEDRTPRFSMKLRDWLKEEWPTLQRDWNLFLSEIDYGADPDRARLTEAVVLPAVEEWQRFGLAVDRSWQSTGLTVEAGEVWQLVASGRFSVAGGERPWPCEAGGITIDYYQGRPLGQLTAGVIPADQPSGAVVDLVAVGATAEIRPARSGKLVLRINENPARMDDNAGNLEVRLKRIR